MKSYIQNGKRNLRLLLENKLDQFETRYGMKKSNDMIPGDPEKKLPASLDIHLRTLLQEMDQNRFREQLPVEFLSDASEGLDQVKDAKHLESVLQKLNQQMHQHLTHKKRKRRLKKIYRQSYPGPIGQS